MSLCFIALAPLPAVEGGSDLIHLKGQFVQVFAIGGETTGMAVKTTDGRKVEVALNRNDYPGLDFGDFVEVTGYFIDVPGVEIPSRPVLVVTSLTILGSPASR